MKIESIISWILISVIIGIAIWLAFGSPEFNTSLIAIILFFASSEFILWRTLFAIDNKNLERFSKLDKRTAVGFEKVSSDFKILDNRFERMERDIRDIKKGFVKL